MILCQKPIRIRHFPRALSCALKPNLMRFFLSRSCTVGPRSLDYNHYNGMRTRRIRMYCPGGYFWKCFGHYCSLNQCPNEVYYKYAHSKPRGRGLDVHNLMRPIDGYGLRSEFLAIWTGLVSNCAVFDLCNFVCQHLHSHLDVDRSIYGRRFSGECVK